MRDRAGRAALEAGQDEVRPNGGGVAVTPRGERVLRRGPSPRRTSGPRPARPGVVPVAVRPGSPARPWTAAEPWASPAPGRGPRVLARRAVLPARYARRRRIAAAVGAVGLVLVAAVAVLLLGLLADVAASARGGGAGHVTPVVTEGAGSVADWSSRVVADPER